MTETTITLTAADRDLIGRALSDRMSICLATREEAERDAATRMLMRLQGLNIKPDPVRDHAGGTLTALKSLVAKLERGAYIRDDLKAARAAIAKAGDRETADAPARQGGTPVIPVDALEWQEIGEEHQPKARLLAALQIGDCMFHVEAREIDPEADPQSTLEYGDDLDKFGDIADQGDFATMTREGREYFVFILPYEA